MMNINKSEFILFSLSSNMKLTHAIGHALSIPVGKAEIRNFPDGESYLRIKSEVKNKTVILVCNLDKPNKKIVPLLFMAKTLNELGALKTLLVAPYLPYMRQDKRFHLGEALTSTIFADLLSNYVDGLITIDPHLHRIHQLTELYSIPSTTLHATKEIADWVSTNVRNPFLIGPDEESWQWVSEIAQCYTTPFIVAHKKRLGDKQVVISLPHLTATHHTPVLIDDIISSGVSMLEVIKELIKRGLKKPICIGVHALFNNQTQVNLLGGGAKEIITCNTINHSTNRINIVGLLAKGIMNHVNHS